MQTSLELAHISADIDLWMYVGWDIIVHLSEYYTPVTIFSTIQ
jgi:hypothetical protein